MKKLFILVLFMSALCGLNAQQSGKYVVWFTNGSSIECVSFEHTGEDYLRIVRLDGRSVTYAMSVVDRITPVRMAPASETPPAVAGKLSATPEKQSTGAEKTPDLVYDGNQTTAARSTPVGRQPQSAVKTETVASKEPEPKQDTGPAAKTVEKSAVTVAARTSGIYGGEYEWVRVVPMKNPFAAGLASVVIPGLGQFYNGRVGLGFAFMGGWLATGAGAYVFFREGDLWPVGAAFAAASAGVWVWSIIHASNNSKKINAQRGYALGNGKYLNAGPAVLPARTFAANNTYHYGLALGITF